MLSYVVFNVAERQISGALRNDEKVCVRNMVCTLRIRNFLVMLSLPFKSSVCCFCFLKCSYVYTIYYIYQISKGCVCVYVCIYMFKHWTISYSFYQISQLSSKLLEDENIAGIVFVNPVPRTISAWIKHSSVGRMSQWWESVSGRFLCKWKRLEEKSEF